MANRLAAETSPYLLQHRDNPVDWYPWGDEAFAAAQASGKAVFVSIGYAACHWCHVMAHESFENPEIAALMNQLFINVKVDREERPDVDQIYMSAIQLMGQGGGWPLSAFCLPDGRPYFLGTYFPPQDRYGRPGFPRLLQTMADVYRNQREQVDANADAVREGLVQLDAQYCQDAHSGTAAALDDQLLVDAGRWLAQRCDAQFGGLGKEPKFPSSSAHDLLGRAGRLPLGEPAREAFLLQARAMARGGLYDHVGGGFARYSVDARWQIPHFEKMLYDNAQLLAIYGDAYAMTGEALFARVIDGTVAWLRREMCGDSGGLFASQDADSEGQEGKYYVWTPEQLEAVLGSQNAQVVARAFGVTEHGNFEHGTTHLCRVTREGAEGEEAELRGLLDQLFAVRDRRIHPDTDTKILAGWNGLAVTGLLRAWGATGNRAAFALAEQTAEFLATCMLGGDGRLARVYKDGRTQLDGTLDDYAFVSRAFFDFAEATGQPIWWERGRGLAEQILARFHEVSEGIARFYVTPCDAADKLFHRPESHHDGALPAGSSVAVEVLLRLGLVAGDARALAVAETYLAQRAPSASPLAGSGLLAALDLYLNAIEVVVSDGQGRDELLAACRRMYAPTLVIAGPWAEESLLDKKTASTDGRAQAYVCRGRTCRAPVADPAALLEELRGIGDRKR
jgi:uncharacterized protein